MLRTRPDRTTLIETRLQALGLSPSLRQLPIMTKRSTNKTPISPPAYVKIHQIDLLAVTRKGMIPRLGRSVTIGRSSFRSSWTKSRSLRHSCAKPSTIFLSDRTD